MAFEAARALGKIRTPEARAALAKYLAAAPATTAAGPIVGEALLSIGRFPPPGDIAPIVRWTASPDVEVRWRAAWALFRPRDPAAVEHLLRMTADKSPEVRFWAVRGLVAAVGRSRRSLIAPSLRRGCAPRSRIPIAACGPRRLRALGGYDDDESFAVVLAALDSPDTLAVGIGRGGDGPLHVAQGRRRAEAGRRRRAGQAAGAADHRADAAGRARTRRGERSRDGAGHRDERRGERGRDADAGAPRRPEARRRRAGPRPPRTPPAAASDDEYRRLVERWIVPDYNGAPKPRVLLETPRGPIEIELYAGDAPMGLAHLVKVVESGEIVGTEFGRVVPNFVDQQRAIRDDVTLRDEVNRRGLTRGNLSWASAGLDTGRPGYTLGNTPQPHNEGDFTSLGRVVRGMDAVDRIELGDKITGARMLK